MSLDPLHGLHPSREARCVFAYLHRRGGSVRLGPLLRGLAMDQRVVLDALNDLSERYWITVVWRKAPPGTAHEDSRPFGDVYRLCTTRFGRRKYRTTWPVD
ncbi:MAG TPA: hypothetical protein VGF29_02730 [Hyphomicrobiaceae bacterium]|jgi:hypothetical protein